MAIDFRLHHHRGVPGGSGAGESSLEKNHVGTFAEKNESIIVNNDISVTIVEIRGDKVRLGIVAPKEVPVHQEIQDTIDGNTQTPPPGPVPIEKASVSNADRARVIQSPGPMPLVGSNATDAKRYRAANANWRGCSERLLLANE